MVIDEERALRLLEERGAATIEHPGGSLLAHLVRVSRILEDWGAPPELVAAGLCHAAYGTDGFPQALLTTDERTVLASIIGRRAELIVYFYCSADRADLHPQIGAEPATTTVIHRDRFDGRESEPSAALVRAFAELTFANELDLLWTSPAFAAAYREGIVATLRPWRPHVSATAWENFTCEISSGA
jgi:hypothetical protein